MGGAAAMGTTPGLPIVLEPPMAGGDSEELPLGVREAIKLDGACWMEFFREDFFEPREVPTARELALLRLRFLITSVLSDKGRTTP